MPSEVRDYLSLVHSDVTPDYIGSVSYDPAKDALQYGVRGMKWGVRRSSAQLRVAASQRTTSTKKSDTTDDSSSSKPTTDTETSQARYAKLGAQVKAGKATDLSNEDLQFFNARTEALAKVAKMQAEKPNWLADTTKTVMKETAKKSMSTITQALADKYIVKPLVGKVQSPDDDSKKK